MNKINVEITDAKVIRSIKSFFRRKKLTAVNKICVYDRYWKIQKGCFVDDLFVIVESKQTASIISADMVHPLSEISDFMSDVETEKWEHWLEEKEKNEQEN